MQILRFRGEITEGLDARVRCPRKSAKLIIVGWLEELPLTTVPFGSTSLIAVASEAPPPSSRTSANRP